MNDVNFDVSAQEIAFKVAEGGGSYTLPPATSSALGGVKADQKQVGDTQPVRIGTDGKLYTAQGGGGGSATDVQINGTSITQDGVANVPVASANTLGVVATDTWNGTTIDATGHIGLFASQETHLNNRTSNTAITPKNLDLALKIALTDGKASWTDAEKASARSLLGVTGTTGSTIDDVQVVGVSVVQDGVANIPVATTNDYGVVKAGNSAFGINKNSSGVIYVANASDAEITARNSAYKPITPNNLNYAVTAVLTDGKAPALSDVQKQAAQSWLGIDTILGLVNEVSEVVG